MSRADTLDAPTGAAKMRAIAFGLLFVGAMVSGSREPNVFDAGLAVASLLGAVICIIGGW